MLHILFIVQQNDQMFVEKEKIARDNRARQARSNGDQWAIRDPLRI